MGNNKLPRRAEERIESFVGIEERLRYFLEATEQQEQGQTQWITQLCEPAYEDVVAFLEDASRVCTSPSFIRLLYRDNTYKDIRDRHIRLVDALEGQNSRLVLEELFKHLGKFTAEDRARSFLLLASEVKVDASEDIERVGWLNRIADSFETSPRALRPQLLLAASIIGNQPMVTLLLRDIAADDKLALNIDAVEAECLIEAAINQHFSVVKELLDGGRFSNGNETRWDAVVKALEVSCTNGAAEIADILLPQYLSYCSVIGSCGAHHPRLLRLALSNWHFEIVELLLECDPRGSLCNIMELIDTLREEQAQATRDPTEAASSSGFLAIVGGEDNDDRGDLEMWDAAALARGVASENPALVRFLVNHVDFCSAALTAALGAAQESGNVDAITIIATKLKQIDEGEALDEIDSEEVEASATSSLNLLYSSSESLKTNDEQPQTGDDESCLDEAVVGPANEGKAGDESEVLPDVVQPATSLEAVRRTSFSVVEQAISIASESVASKTTERTEDKLPLLSVQDKPDLPRPSAVNVALLRKFSVKAVDQILCEGQLAASQRKMAAHAEASAMQSESFRIRTSSTKNSIEENTNESSEIGAGAPIADAETQLPLESCSRGRKTPNENEETHQALTDIAELSAAVAAERFPCANDGRPFSLLDWISATEKGGDPRDNTADADAGLDNAPQHDEAPMNSASSLVSKRVADQTGREDAVREENSADPSENLPMETRPAQVSEPARRTNTLHVSCSINTPVSKPQRLTSPVSSASASPNRSTIVCPVKWVEHATGTHENADLTVDSCGPLREGDHVEVHYKGRSILFPGVIAFCHANGTYDVLYEDGDEESCVPRELIQPVKASQSGPLDVSQTAGEGFMELPSVDIQPNTAEECTLAIENGPRTSLRDTTCGQDDENCSKPAREPSCVLLKGLADDALQGTRSNETVDATKTSVEALLEFVPVPNSTSSALVDGSSDRDQATRSQKALVLGHRASSGELYRTIAASVDGTHPLVDSVPPPLQRQHVDDVVSIDLLPEIPSIAVPSTTLETSPGAEELVNEVRLATGTSQRTLRGRPASVTSQSSRCRTADNVSAQELAEWKNVDLLLNRKRRLLQSQTGSVESVKVPWGEEFATIQSLKRFATQHPDILRAHIETQLRELDGPLSSPGKPRSPRTRNASSHSGAGEARGSLLLMKDLAFLLQHRLAPFFDAIVPVVMPTVFNAEKRFLCETAAEVMDAIILHCSGRKLVLLFLQLGETYSKYEDLRLYNLAYVYVEKSVHNWSKSELASLQSSVSPTLLLTLLAKALGSKSAPVRIAVQKSFRHLHDELGTQAFNGALRAHVGSDLEALVLKECGARVKPENRKKTRAEGRRSETRAYTNGPTIAQSGTSILQRMLVHKKNRVLPAQT